MNKKAGQSAAERVAALLRRDLLHLPDGEFLGFEQDLLAKLSISRPTFRQVVRVLESEQILEVRRGARGGCYVRKPDVQVVGRMAALFLGPRRPTMQQVLQTSAGLTRAVVSGAAISTDEAARAELQFVVHEVAAQALSSLPQLEWQLAEKRLAQALAKLANNPTLELFIAMLDQVGLDRAWAAIFRDRSDRISEHVRTRLAVADAVLNGDVEIADLLVARANAQLFQWFDEDLRRRVGT